MRWKVLPTIPRCRAQGPSCPPPLRTGMELRPSPLPLSERRELADGQTDGEADTGSSSQPECGCCVQATGPILELLL